MEKISPFNKAHASTYDDQWKRMSPMVEGLHFLMKIILRDMHKNAKVLCIGAGTGSEILALAEAFPYWTFTAVDPAEAMLEVCRDRVEKAGFIDRCHFHVGYLSSLQNKEKFDVVTSILVSQFLPQREKRIEFFQEMAQRLNPGSYLISADLASPESPVIYDQMSEAWNQVLRFAGFPEERVQLATSSWRKEVAVSHTKEIESIISAGGFDSPTLFHQSLFIHAWYARLAVATSL